MAKLKMKRIEILAPIEEVKDIIDLLQRRSVIELTENEESAALETLSTHQSVSQFEKYYAAAKAALDVLDKYSPESKGLIASLLPQKSDMTLSEYLEKSDNASDYLNLCFDINSAQKDILDAKTGIARCKALLESLKPWLDLDVPMKYEGTKQTSAFIGTLPAVYTAQELKTALTPILGDEERFECEIVSASKDRSCVFIVCHNECKQQIFNALRALGFAYPSDPTKHPPRVRYERYEKEIKRLEESSAAAEKLIKESAVHRDDLRFVCDYFAIRKDKYDALNKLSMSQSVFVITGYIAEKNIEGLLRELDRSFVTAVSISEPAEDEDVPVELENDAFSGAVESITQMYSLPGKDDVDPNPVMSFFYYMLFGIMLSDAGYGLVMVIAMLVAKLALKPAGKMKKTVDMYFYCGIATVFWGALFGSWFGDIVNVVAEQFFNKDIGSLALWFEPVNDPMKLLLYSFLFGIIHLFAGLGISFYNMWKHGNRLGAVCDVIPVYLLITGLAPLGAGIVIDIDPTVKAVGKYLALAGAVLIVLTAGRSSKNIVGKLGLGLYGLYNTASGWLSDILSYSRLLALGLCTGVIATVINTLGTIPENKAVKLCLLVPVFLFGHVVNMAINLIGTYVHTNRLQYVEFFAKFYEGGGRAFTPLKADTKYFKFKED